MTLYELTEDYMNLLELAEDPDIDEQAFMDTLDGIEGAIEIKAENYAKVMRQLEPMRLRARPNPSASVIRNRPLRTTSSE